MNKKHINKAGFKSFFKNKIGAILLAFIVFLSAATFTVLQSSVSNYTSSYDHVIKEGKLHDYTMKESYSTNGDVKYEVVKDGNKPDEEKYLLTDTTTKYTNDKLMLLSSEQDPAGGWTGFNKDLVKNHTTKVGNWFPSTVIKSMLLNTKGFTFEPPTGTKQKYTVKYPKDNRVHLVIGFERTNTATTNVKSISESKTSIKAYAILNSKNMMEIYNEKDGKQLVNGGTNLSFIGMTRAKLLDAITKSVNLINNVVPTFKSGVDPMFNKVKTNDFILQPKVLKADFRLEFDRDKSLHVSSYIKKLRGVPVWEPDPTWHSTQEHPVQLRPFTKSEQNAINDFKLVMKTNILKFKADNFVTKMRSDVASKYKTNLITKRINSVSISDNGKSFKVVDTSANNDIDKIVINEGEPIVKSTLTESYIKTLLKQKQVKINSSGTDLKFRMSEVWRYSLEFQNGLVPGVVSVIDSSSYSAIVSSSYAAAHNIKPIGNAFFHTSKFLNAVSNQQDTTDLQKLAKENANSVVKIGSLTYFVSGIGTSPDFAYPIISSRQPVVNVNDQAVIFTNEAGYMRAKSSFSSADVESYVAIGFGDNLSWEDKQLIMDDVEVMAHKSDGMDFPSNIQIISKFDDTNEKIIMAPQRVSFLKRLNHTISSISWITIIGMMLLTTLVVMVTIKRIISSEKKTLAIANANGYSKWVIAGSYIPAALLIVGLSSIVGYITGITIQPLFSQIFKNFWTIPLDTVHFSFISLVLTAIVPAILIGLLVLIIVMTIMRGRVVDNLSDKESRLGQAFSSTVMKLIGWTGIKTKIAISFIVTNMGKMLLIAGATAVGVSVVTVGLTSAGKFNTAITNTKDVNRYEFAVDLVSPTEEGGMYHAVIPSDPSLLATKFKGKPTRYWMGMQSTNGANGTPVEFKGMPDKSAFANIKGKVDKATATTAFSNWISTSNFPGVWGGIAYKNTVSYGWNTVDKTGYSSMEFLKGKIQSKSLLNTWIGAFGIGTNPWDINKQLMPKNQQNLANNDYISYLSKLYNLKSVKDKFNGEIWYSDLGKILATKTSTTNSKLLEDFRKAITISASGLFSFAKPNNIRKSYKDAIVLGYKEGVYPFVLAYDQVTMDSEDETYTSLRGKASLASHKGDKVLDLSVKGINEDSRFIKIGSKNIRTLKAYKGTSVPVVVNQYMKRFYDLSVGSKFKLQVTNGLRRYSDKSTKVSKTIEVVGFVNSYSNNEIVSLRKTINKALGYDSKEGFNGIFSGAKEPIALRNVNLYSPSGLYPAFNTFNPDPSNEYSDLVSTYLTSRAGKKMLYQPTAATKSTPAYPTDVQTFVNTYSNHMYQSTISDVEWARMDDFTFKSINNLSSSLIMLVEAVALIIAIIFIVILGSIMLESNKRNISTLKVVGYRNSEIRHAFLKSILPSLIGGMLISIPIVFAVLIGMQFAIMGFGAVLIPLSMLGWELLTAALLVSLIFILIFTLSIRALKGQSALEAFKE